MPTRLIKLKEIKEREFSPWEEIQEDANFDPNDISKITAIYYKCYHLSKRGGLICQLLNIRSRQTVQTGHLCAIQLEYCNRTHNNLLCNFIEWKKFTSFLSQHKDEVKFYFEIDGKELTTKLCGFTITNDGKTIEISSDREIAQSIGNGEGSIQMYIRFPLKDIFFTLENEKIILEENILVYSFLFTEELPTECAIGIYEKVQKPPQKNEIEEEMASLKKAITKFKKTLLKKGIYNWHFYINQIIKIMKGE